MRLSTAGDPSSLFALNAMLVLFNVGLHMGDERLSDVTGKEPRRASRSREKKHAPRPKAAGGGSPRSKLPIPKSSSPRSSSDVGRALRSVYDDTLGERVPDDFLELLGKLN